MPDDKTQEGGNPNPETKPDRLYANKYRTVEDLESGYANSTKEALRWRDEALKAQGEAAALRSAKPVEPSAAEKRLAEEEVPVDALREVVRTEFEGLFSEALAPFAKAQEAQSKLRQAHSDFDLNEIQNVVMQDPEVSAAYQTLLAKDPEGAYMLGYQTWRASQKPSAVKKEERNAAGMPVAQRGAGGQEEALDEERYKKLLAYGLETGDMNPFLRYRFKGTSVEGLADPNSKGWGI